MSPKTKQQAIRALDNMARIVKNEMLVRGVYVSDEVDEAKRTDICGGYRYCAIGSLWAGAGVKPHVNEYGVSLPGVDIEWREQFLRHRHGLRLALQALNLAATNYVEKHEVEVNEEAYENSPDSIEALFEGSSEQDFGRDDLLAVVLAAKAQIEATL